MYEALETEDLIYFYLAEPISLTKAVPASRGKT
jgi:hypothetical protein